jgi:hypothetical protein
MLYDFLWRVCVRFGEAQVDPKEDYGYFRVGPFVVTLEYTPWTGRKITWECIPPNIKWR